ncbi:hypothetical protein PENANT_c087G00925 [Penicillium antarcticum]|uniref:Asl1-like glycosyl hydrolase catalytic domain-containing protein n=1 Tax=Penicillium antarcticum TaxID=416450 RepID=A0A1V6PM61_9EURO|nr:CAZyme family [Penicillium antarcticum]KAJ5288421.1 CAZyme family [Penicillium antarcticum]OQD78110.1 hypothetical protein PENANT_c087G00925 [Penicillium antarcticum]
MTFVATLLMVSLNVLSVSRVGGEAISKRGAAYNDISNVSPLSEAGTVSWAYNWAVTEPKELPPGVEFVPMLWGTANFDGWQASLESTLSSGSNYILGFNEPDMSSQASLSPSVAAKYYREYITPFQSKAKLVSPAVTSSTSPDMGLGWLGEFMGACSSCSISGVAVHWYGDSADSFKGFIYEVITFARSYGLSEVWITEFGLEADINGVTDDKATETFIHVVTPWLDSQSLVARYSYFMCAEGYLLSGGALNAAGKAYISSPGSSDSISFTSSSVSCNGAA